MNESNASLSNNSLLNTYCKFRRATDFEKIARHTAFVLLSVVGISLNIFVIILAAKYTVRKNLHHLIINMAVSDSLFLFMKFWDYLPRMLDFKWRIYPRGIWGVIFCKTQIFMFNSAYMVSLITLLIISIERIKATRQRLQRSRQYTLKQRLLVISFSWLISTPFAVFYATNADLYYSGKACFPWTNGHTTTVGIIIRISNFSVIAIFCCVILFLSILTIRRLTKPQAIHNHLSQEQRTERARRTQAAVRMVLASVLLYICCWLPLFVYLLLRWVSMLIPSANIFSECIDRRSLSFVMNFLLPNINSAFSPCIYIIFLSDFRQAAKKVFCRRNTLNQAPTNRRNSFEVQPMARRRQICQEEDIEL